MNIKAKIERVTIPQNDNMFRRTTLDVSFQGVGKLFAAAYETGDIQRNTNHQHSRRDIIYLEQKLKM